MAIDLVKRGQVVELTKKHSGLQRITIGLSWGSGAEDPYEKDKESSGGLLGLLFGGGRSNSSSAPEMDIDSSILTLDKNRNKVDLVFYGHKYSTGIQHMGDDRTGHEKYGVYDNEEINIDLNRIPSNVETLVVILNIYNASYNEHFGLVKGAFTRVLNSDNREELIRYDLADSYNGMKGLIVSEIYRYEGEWRFRAIGAGTKEYNLERIVRQCTR